MVEILVILKSASLSVQNCMKIEHKYEHVLGLLYTQKDTFQVSRFIYEIASAIIYTTFKPVGC